METAEQKLQRAKNLMLFGRHADAKEIINGLIGECSEELVCLGARFIRARAYEDGTFGEVLTEAANNDFLILRNSTSAFRVEGILGSVRMMLRMDPSSSGRVAAKLCEEAAEIYQDTRAMMLLGFIYENVLKDQKLAIRWYLRAYTHGSAWGLRYYAALRIRQKKYVRGILAHIAATITAPIMVVRFGTRTPFK